MKRLFVIMFAYIVCVFAICLGISSTFGTLPLLLPQSVILFRINRGILYFLNILPALVCSSFLVGCSISFGRNSSKCLTRYSPAIFKHFKNIMISALCLCFVLVMANEIVSPRVAATLQRCEESPYLLSEYLVIGKQNYKDGKTLLAHEYARYALEIDNNNEDARALLDKTEAILNTMQPVIPDIDKRGDRYDVNETPATVTALIEKSEAAAKSASEGKGSWFDAHYYAQQAIRIGSGSDINLDDARQDAAIAWNHLSVPSEEKETASQVFFREKRSAYILLMQGSVLEAYYRFISLSEESRVAADDPDVKRYLEIARERLNSDYFFIDETENLQRFESATNIHFCLQHSDHTSDVIYIRGVTSVRNSGNMVRYLRGLSIYSFDQNGRFVKSFEVPYAKMFVEPVSTFGESMQKELDLKKEYKQVPYILLNSVSRMSEGVIIKPSFTYAESNNIPQEQNLIILSMPATNFDLICDAAAGAERMNLLSLIQFVPVAHNFGYSEEVYGSMMIRRLMFPLLFLILLVFLASFAWNYRIGEKQVFKFKWIFVLPLTTVVVDSILKGLRAVLNLVDFLFSGLFGQYALVISFFCWIFILFVVSVLFLRRTSN